MSYRIGDVPAKTTVLVIGSGFGGSVVAERLAAAGVQVCVIERGKAYPPGSFPRTPAEFAQNFWAPDRSLYGLFDIWSFRGLEAIVPSGLGGGSLIYANVMLRKPRDWFRQPHPHRPGVTEYWSFTRDDLDPHYSAVEQFLDIQYAPVTDDDPADVFHLPKTAAFRQAAGPSTTLAPLAVRFRDAAGEPAVGAPLPDADYPNIFGAHRRSCALIGECDIGCNEGAKSSLDHTYLSAAAAHDNAAIHVQTEAKTIESRPDGTFAVGVRSYGADGERADTTITADRVVVSAGTFGSTFLLLRNRAGLNLPADGPLGTRFCGNGDLLGLVINARNHQALEGTRGPVITASRRYDDGHGMYLQDAGFPNFAAWLIETRFGAGHYRRMARFSARRLAAALFRRGQTSISGDIAELLGDGTFTNTGMPVLGMGRDVPDGRLFLRGDDVLESDWTSATSAPHFDALTQRMRAVATALGGRFVPNPTYLLKKRVVTVHPLGGCPADTSESVGVVDSYGRVHGVPGLWVVDGSVFPGPVGPNPSLTIAAFARRAADQLLADGG
ncbi:GMC oxidoreductase [Mycolicibacterium thermoresistibile]